MVRTSEPKNQEFHKHNEPQPKIRCSYKKTRVLTHMTYGFNAKRLPPNNT